MIEIGRILYACDACHDGVLRQHLFLVNHMVAKHHFEFKKAVEQAMEETIEAVQNYMYWGDQDNKHADLSN